MVVAAFRNLQIGVVAWRQFDSTRQQVHERILVRRRRRFVDCRHHRFVRCRPRDRQNLRIRFANQIGSRTQTTGNDDAAILGQGLVNGLERFGDCAFDEATGIHDDDVGLGIARRRFVTLDTQLCQDPL